MIERWESNGRLWARTTLQTAYVLRTVPSIIAEDALYGQTRTAVDGEDAGAGLDLGAVELVQSAAGVELGVATDLGALDLFVPVAGAELGAGSDVGALTLVILSTDLLGEDTGASDDLGTLVLVVSLSGQEGGASADSGAVRKVPRPDPLRLVACAEPLALVLPEESSMSQRKQYDTHPPIRVYLRIHDGGNEGPAPNLAAASTVVVKWRRPSGSSTTRAVTVEDVNSGLVEVPYFAGDFDEIGHHSLEFLVTTAEGVETYPKRGYYTLTVFAGLS